MSLKQNLGRIRKERGLTVQELSAMTEITVKSLYAYQRGDRHPGVHKLRVLANALQCTVDDLTGEEKPNMAMDWKHNKPHQLRADLLDALEKEINDVLFGTGEWEFTSCEKQVGALKYHHRILKLIKDVEEEEANHE